ncbi:uncharacterized protein LOC132285499 [Cornus florida]|uniref:uncharacterized protein LOC132285447 n=1 Tax=Cornus florida TaxID=4283 RepID=UPI00289F9392|nr:uncharacterized protein LOC132285447 [Cornus florida]XP_059643674.1 uncharacterized protein LOC132285499 [Cornus florida]
MDASSSSSSSKQQHQQKSRSLLLLSSPFIHTPFPPQLFTQSSHSKPNLQSNVNIVRHLHSSIVSTAENCLTFLDTFASPNPLLDKIFHFFSSHFHNFSQDGAVESWTNLFGLDFDREGSVKVIGWKRNGEVLLTKDEEMVSVDIKTQEFKNVGMRGYDEAFCVNVYTESLVLIDKVHGGFGEQARSSLLQAPRAELEEPRKL